MGEERTARLFFGATAVLVTFGLVLQLFLVINSGSGEGAFESTPARVVNFFSFFTVQSNILVAVTTDRAATALSCTKHQCGSVPTVSGLLSW